MKKVLLILFVCLFAEVGNAQPVAPPGLAKSQNLADLPSVSTARTNLGLGSMALQNPAAVAITGGTIAGLTSLGVTGTTTLFSGGTNPLTFTPNNITATGAYVSGSSGTFQINADLLTSVP